MTSLSRFSASVESSILERFDSQIKAQGYPTRSKAISDLIRSSLVEEEWKSSGEVVGAIILVYDHHRSGLAGRLTAIQHEYYDLIVSSQHVHLDHDNCLEIIVVRGKATSVKVLSDKLKAAKGVKYASLAAASTGRGI